MSSAHITHNSIAPDQEQHHLVDDSMLKRKGEVVFNNSWLKTFRENKKKYGHPEALQMQKEAEEYAKYKKMKSKARMKAKRNGRATQGKIRGVIL